MSKKIVIELTQDEAETLADSIGDHVSEMYDLYGCDLDERPCMADAKKTLDRLTDIRLKVLTALSKDKHQSVIEWHSMDEEPKAEDGTSVLVLKKGGDEIYDDSIYWNADDELTFIRINKDYLSAWAYMPKEES